jgi:hypothetical protein
VSFTVLRILRTELSSNNSVIVELLKTPESHRLYLLNENDMGHFKESLDSPKSMLSQILSKFVLNMLFSPFALWKYNSTDQWPWTNCLTSLGASV